MAKLLDRLGIAAATKPKTKLTRGGEANQTAVVNGEGKIFLKGWLRTGLTTSASSIPAQQRPGVIAIECVEMQVVRFRYTEFYLALRAKRDWQAV